MKQLYNIDEFGSVYCDALVTKNNDLLFGSFWGRDTTIMEFLSRFQLSGSDGGLSFMTVEGMPAYVRPDKLEKQTGRINNRLFGQLVHLWLYDDLIIKPDLVNHRKLIMLDGVMSIDEVPSHLIWSMIKTVSPYPLLEGWRFVVTQQVTNEGYLTFHQGLNVSGVELQIPDDEFGEFLSSAVRSRVLVAEVQNG